jgi:tetratricopeptide (TPR) repeat protein
MAANLDSLAAETRLDSWKEIATFFGRDERTVKRWEKERGLPVHRVPGSAHGTVFAYTSELTRWLQGTNEVSAASQPDPALPVGTTPASRHPSLDLEHSSTPARRGLLRTLVWILPVLLLAGFLFSFSIGHREIGFKNALAVGRQPDAAAQDLCLKGRYHFEKRTPEDLNKAVDFFTQAIVHDPGYAPAYVGLADCYNLLREFAAMPAQEAYQRAFAAAQKAVELDPNSAAAHNSLAFASFWGYLDAATAEREFKRALELDPNFTRTHHWYATFLSEIGRSKEALAEVERARQLDPSSKAILADKGFILAGAGRTEEARTLLKQMEASDPNFASAHFYLADMVYAREGNYEAAFEESRTAAVLRHDTVLEKQIDAEQSAYQNGGVQGLLEYQLTSAQQDYQQGSGSPYAVAVAYGNLGQRDEAMKYLELARQQHDPGLASLTFKFAFRFLHSDPEFRDLVTQIGLPAVQ